MLRSSNPVLKESAFHVSDTQEGPMTIQGTVSKTLLSILLLLVGGSYSWGILTQNPSSGTGIIILGGILALVAGFVTVLKPHLAPYSTPAYAILEGLALGGISALFEQQYSGIVFQAIGLTIATLTCLLIAYQSKLIQVTENFKLGITAATGGIFIFYMADFLLGLFGVRIPVIQSTGLFGIGFSVFVVTIAALNLVMDFDFIEKGAEKGAPKYMEWYGAFGLMVTLVWLYVEILRLLSKLRGRD